MVGAVALLAIQMELTRPIHRRLSFQTIQVPEAQPSSNATSYGFKWCPPSRWYIFLVVMSQSLCSSSHRRPTLLCNGSSGERQIIQEALPLIREFPQCLVEIEIAHAIACAIACAIAGVYAIRS